MTIVSDSKVAVSWIHDDQCGSLDHVDLVYDIQNFLQVFVGLWIQFSSRDSNSFVDGLMKLGSNSNADRLEWDVFLVFSFLVSALVSPIVPALYYVVFVASLCCCFLVLFCFGSVF